jgi:hypothetical protein
MKCCYSRKHKKDSLIHGSTADNVNGSESNVPGFWYEGVSRMTKEFFACLFIFGVVIMIGTRPNENVIFPESIAINDPIQNTTYTLPSNVPTIMPDHSDFEFSVTLGITAAIALVLFRGVTVNPIGSLIAIGVKKAKDIRYKTGTPFCESLGKDLCHATIFAWTGQFAGCFLALYIPYLLNGHVVSYTKPGIGVSDWNATVIEGMFFGLLTFCSCILHIVYDSEVCLSGVGVNTRPVVTEQVKSDAAMMGGSLFIAALATFRYSGASLHWFRSFAACVLGGEYGSYIWMYLGADIIGGALALLFAWILSKTYFKDIAQPACKYTKLNNIETI